MNPIYSGLFGIDEGTNWYLIILSIGNQLKNVSERNFKSRINFYYRFTISIKLEFFNSLFYYIGPAEAFMSATLKSLFMSSTRGIDTTL